MDIAKEKQAKLAPGFISDVTFLAGGKNFSITHAKIHGMMTKPNSTYEWSREHNSFFEMDQLKLEFCRRKENDCTQKGKTCPMARPPLDLTFDMIMPSPTHKLLCLILYLTKNYNSTNL